MYITGGQPARGPELGSIKFRNSTFSLRNFFIMSGRGCYYTEYHKSRASTNFSYFVVRYLPDTVTALTLLYIAYIRPFISMIYNQTSSNKNVAEDGNYLFCNDESPHECWNGQMLSKILQKETQSRLGVKVNMWAYRHIVIGIAKKHLKEVGPYFERDDEAAEQLQMQHPDSFIYAWQATHQRVTNISTYGLDKAVSLPPSTRIAASVPANFSGLAPVAQVGQGRRTKGGGGSPSEEKEEGGSRQCRADDSYRDDAIYRGRADGLPRDDEAPGNYRRCNEDDPTAKGGKGVERQA